MKQLTCPLCSSVDPCEYKQINDTHVWLCCECPFVAIEYYNKQNTDDLIRLLKLRSK